MEHSHHEFIKNTLAIIGAAGIAAILLAAPVILVRLIKDRKKAGRVSTHPGER